MGDPLPSGGRDAGAPGAGAALHELSQAFLTVEHALSFYPEGHQSRTAPMARLVELLRAEARAGGAGELAGAGESVLWRGAVLEDPPPVVRKFAALLGALGIARISWSEGLEEDEVRTFMTRVAAARGAGHRGVWEDAGRYEHLRVEGPDYQALMTGSGGESDTGQRAELWRALLPRLVGGGEQELSEADLALVREPWGDPEALASLLTDALGPAAAAGAPEAVAPLRRLAGLAESAAAGEADRDAQRQQLAALGRRLPPQLRLRLLEATLDEPAGGLFDAAFGALAPAEAVALVGGAFSLEPSQIERLTRVFQHLVPRRLERMELAPQLREQVRAGADPDDPIADNAWEEVQELLTGESGEFMSPSYQEQLRRLAARETERREGEAALAELPELTAALEPERTAAESLRIQFEQLRLATSAERYREAVDGLAGRCAAALAAGDRERGFGVLRVLLEVRAGGDALAGPREELERSLRGLATAPVLTALIALLPSLAAAERPVAQAFVALAPETAVPLLLDALAVEQHPESRQAIAALLEGLPGAAPEVLRRLEGAPAAQARLLLALVAESADAQAVPALLRLLGGDDAKLRRDALRALLRIDGDEVRRALPRLLDDRDPEIVQAAAAHLGASGSPETVRELLRAFDGGLITARRADRMRHASFVLGRMRAVEAVAPLGELLVRRAWFNRRAWEQVCEEAAKALSRIGGDAARLALEQGAARGPVKVAALCRRLLARQGGA